MSEGIRKRPYTSAQDKLYAELQRLHAETKDARFAAAAEAVREHPSAFALPGRRPRPLKRRQELDAMAERTHALAIGGLSIPNACKQAVREHYGRRKNKTERDDEVKVVVRHYHEVWRPKHGWKAGDVVKVREMLS
ncbi:hypothetical protein GAY28_05755 [Azospirillum brasilense]|nr:hypothetical protein [Azospirillum brasilense]